MPLQTAFRRIRPGTKATWPVEDRRGGYGRYDRADVPHERRTRCYPETIIELYDTLRVTAAARGAAHVGRESGSGRPTCPRAPAQASMGAEPALP